MVGRRSTVHITKRSLRNNDGKEEKRPRRTVQAKILDDTVGMSRKEEQELNKALYASLQSHRRSHSMPILPMVSVHSISDDSNGINSSEKQRSDVRNRKSSPKSPVFKKTRHSLGSSKPQKPISKLKPPNRISPKRIIKRSGSQRSTSVSNLTVLTNTRNISVDESSQDSARSSTSSANESKRKIHAQRKFAQGCSLPGTPVSTPVKSVNTPVKIFSSRIPKTEDFLTFLCFRGTSLLPPHLDFFNFSREELPAREETSRSSSVGRGKPKRVRESTPDSSSSCGASEEVAETAQAVTPNQTSRSANLLNTRSAARASAGTPETARGIVSLRQGLQRKKTSTSSTPVRSTSQRSDRSGGSTGSKVKTGSASARGQVNTARKSLLGKLTSVARQQAKKIVGRSTKMAASRLRTRSKTQNNSPTGRKIVNRKSESTRETRHRKRRMDPEDSNEDQDEENSEVKKGRRIVRRSVNTRNRKLSRRVSTRLREAAQTLRFSRRKRLSDTADDVDGDIVEKKVKLSEKRSDSRLKVKKDENKKSETQKRQRYKIRPIERVRTRGYSLLLASKNALKRAKRENVTLNKVKQLQDKDRRSTSSAKDRDDDAEDKDVKKSLKPSQTRSQNPRSDLPCIEDVVEIKGKTSPSERLRSRSLSQDSSETGSVTRQGSREKTQSPSVKKSPPKKAKTTSSASPATSQNQNPDDQNTIPIFRPSEAEFMDPIAYISKIQPQAEAYGMCKIIPPASWKLDSNKINEDIRFTSQVQYIHRLHKRWGPNVQHNAAIHRQLHTQAKTDIPAAPQMGGVEVDLPKLYQLVQEAGGLRKMADRKHWARVADNMNIPKQVLDRSNRLYNIYCSHILPYATLAESERSHLDIEVKSGHNLPPNEVEAIVKGKSMSVSWFNRIARNVQSMWCKDDSSTHQVESEYWSIVEERDRHVAVQCGHINTRAQASVFPTRKESVYSRHPWNLNNVPENSGCVLKYLGPVPGITIPTLHIGMLFSTSCWSTDPHNLPYIQYLHTGADVIWYSIPRSQQCKFRTAMLETAPSLLVNKPKWLKEDCVMVNPAKLREKNVKVERCVHRPREFVVVFSGTYTATISCGLSVSESVHYASHKWIPGGLQAANALTRSGEKELFSISALLCNLAQDSSVDGDTLTEALKQLSPVIYKELDLRTQLLAAGLRSEKRNVFSEAAPSSTNTSRKRPFIAEENKVCEICEKICYLSMILNEDDEQVLCLDHGLRHIQKKKNVKSTRLFVRHSQNDLELLLKQTRDRLTSLSSQTSSPSSCKTRGNSK